MAVWAIADLHLSFGVSGKRMDCFGPAWIDHHQKIAANWRACVAPDDLVLIAGDISWALRLTEALPDLQWLDALPGEKLLVRGNHDLWWPKSRTKLAGVLPGSLHFLHRSAFRWRNVAVAGSRLWDIPGLRFDAIVQASESNEHTEPHSIPPDQLRLPRFHPGQNLRLIRAPPRRLGPLQRLPNRRHTDGVSAAWAGAAPSWTCSRTIRSHSASAESRSSHVGAPTELHEYFSRSARNRY